MNAQHNLFKACIKEICSGQMSGVPYKSWSLWRTLLRTNNVAMKAVLMSLPAIPAHNAFKQSMKALHKDGVIDLLRDFNTYTNTNKGTK